MQSAFFVQSSGGFAAQIGTGIVWHVPTVGLAGVRTHNKLPQASELAHVAPMIPPVLVGTGGVIAEGAMGFEEVARGLVLEIGGVVVRAGAVVEEVEVVEGRWVVVLLTVEVVDVVSSIVVLTGIVTSGFEL